MIHTRSKVSGEQWLMVIMNQVLGPVHWAARTVTEPSVDAGDVVPVSAYVRNLQHHGVLPSAEKALEKNHTMWLVGRHFSWLNDGLTMVAWCMMIKWWFIVLGDLGAEQFWTNGIICRLKRIDSFDDCSKFHSPRGGDWTGSPLQLWSRKHPRTADWWWWDTHA